MTAIILAGGKAVRMGGQDKAFLKIGNEFLINRQRKLLRKVFKNIIVVTNSLEKYKEIRGTMIITDVISACGPLGGIYSGLMASKSKYNFVVACDMPFLNASLIRYMISLKDSYDVIIPRIDEKFHPLFGIYSKNCIPIIGDLIKQSKLNVSSIFSKVKIHFISRKEIERYDENLLSLLNLNTPSDLAGLRKIR